MSEFHFNRWSRTHQEAAETEGGARGPGKGEPLAVGSRRGRAGE